MSRRARISPDDVGFPTDRRRRVAGLRREEVAILAGVSVEYYVQIERGKLSGVSDEVLTSIAKALRLDEVEWEHFFNLARAAGGPRTRTRRRSRAAQAVPVGVQLLTDSMMNAAAIVLSPRLDVLTANPIGRAQFSPLFERGDELPNFARFVFLDERSTEFYPAWDSAADNVAALLRVEAGKNTSDQELANLIGQLSTRSQDFSRRWAQQNLRAHQRGTKSFMHPIVGELDLRFEALDIPRHPGLSIASYLAQPGTESHDKLQIPASWVAEQAAETAQDPVLEPSPNTPVEAPGRIGKDKSAPSHERRRA